MNLYLSIIIASESEQKLGKGKILSNVRLIPPNNDPESIAIMVANHIANLRKEVSGKIISISHSIFSA